MSWADRAIQELREGRTTQVRPHGQSMRGRVESGSLVTLVPCKAADLKENDIVLVRVKGNVYLHLVKAKQEDRLLIGNNRGGINGWVSPQAVYGLATKIENGG